jgi:hypothetical protein
MVENTERTTSYIFEWICWCREKYGYKCPFKTVSQYFGNLPGGNKDKMSVLLCAPSSKAAYLIDGVTLHTAFALLFNNSRKCTNVSSDLENTIREQLFHVKLLIIDEISRVGSSMPNMIDHRLRQIFGIDKPFGDISVVCCGDLFQLPPVLDSPIYKPSKSCSCLIVVTLQYYSSKQLCLLELS